MGWVRSAGCPGYPKPKEVYPSLHLRISVGGIASYRCTDRQTSSGTSYGGSGVNVVDLNAGVSGDSGNCFIKVRRLFAKRMPGKAKLDDS